MIRIFIFSFFVCSVLVVGDLLSEESSPISNILVREICGFAQLGDTSAFILSVGTVSDDREALESIFRFATKLGGEFYFAYMLHTFDIEINSRNSIGENATFYVMQSDVERDRRLKILQDFGLDINSARKDGEVPLHSAARANDVEFMIFLHDLLPEIPLDTHGDNGRTPLMYAAEFGNIEAVEWLLVNGADAAKKDGEDKMAADLVLPRDATLELPEVSEDQASQIRHLLSP